MNTLERQSLTLYAMIGGGVGFLAGIIPPIALLQPLRQQVDAYEQAVSEIQGVSVGTQGD